MMSDVQRSITQRVSTVLFRCATFRSLALGFTYPSHTALQQLKTQWTALLIGAHPWPASTRQSFQDTNELLCGTDEQILAPEYVRLFGPVARCPLHETAYGDAGRLLGRSASLADIAGFYLAFELRPANADPHREDHIGLELEFMSLLALKEAYAIAEGQQEALEITRTTQQRFLQDHLGTWIDAFTAQMKLCEPHPFYASLGESLCAWVHTETMRLQASPVPVGGPMTDTLMAEDSLQCPYAPTDP